MHVNIKMSVKMKTFQDYLNENDNEASSSGSDDAYNAAIQAFEIVMSKNSKAAVNFLNDISSTLPEIKTILQKYGLDSFKSVNPVYERKNGRKITHKGLGDFSTHDVNDRNVDVIATNAADSYQNPIG